MFFLRALSDCSSFATEAELLTEWPGESEEFGWMEDFVVNLAVVLPSWFSRVLFSLLGSGEQPEIKSFRVSVITSPNNRLLAALGTGGHQGMEPKGRDFEPVVRGKGLCERRELHR